MEKFTASSMAATMTSAVAGCGFKPTEITAAGTTTAETAASADTTAVGPAAGEETNAVTPGKKYIINTDTISAPFEFENEKGETVGVDLGILQAAVQDQGFECKVVSVGFSAAVTALETDECDGTIAGMSVTDERVQKYDFSKPYYNSGIGMATLSDSDITSYDQLKDQKMAAKIGIEGCTFTESIAEQYSFEIIQYESSSDMYQAVIAGEAVVCFEDCPAIGYEISGELSLTLPTPTEKGSSYGFVTLKGANPEPVEMLSKGLENIKVSGRYDEILSTYIAK